MFFFFNYSLVSLAPFYSGQISVCKRVKDAKIIDRNVYSNSEMLSFLYGKSLSKSKNLEPESQCFLKWRGIPKPKKWTSMTSKRTENYSINTQVVTNKVLKFRPRLHYAGMQWIRYDFMSNGELGIGSPRLHYAGMKWIRWARSSVFV